jgi:ankyrin repeat protein
MNGKEEMVNLLLSTESQANPDIADNYSWTALHYAAWRGHTSVVKKLLKRANPNIPDNLGQLPLHLGAERRHRRIVELLCHYKEEMVATCKDGQTVLHRAAWGGDHDVVKTVTSRLLHRELKDTLHAKDNDGKTALHVAAENGYVNNIDFLLRDGYFDHGVADKEGQTAQSSAYSNGHTECVDRLRACLETS